MEIKRIKLENIRSYVNQELELSRGNILLAGDIGSGKSSVLLGIDFALFGLQKGELSGGALLRNGEDKGSVELHFNIDNKDVLIKRTLKRTQNGIVQDAGQIIINGSKREATTTELRQAILDLFGYPQELLTKSKSLIYRYTVYTPQEEMKYILLSDKEERLETIRKVFGIDKYKRISQNTEKFLSRVKEKVKEFDVRIENLPRLKEDVRGKELSFKEIKEKVVMVKPRLEDIKIKINSKKKEIENVEKEMKEFERLNRDLSVNETLLKSKIEKLEENSEKLENLGKEIERLEKDVKDFKEIKFDKQELKRKEEELERLEEKLFEINNSIQEFKTKRESSEEIKKKFLVLNECPYCKQTVEENHKHDVVNEENKKIEIYEKKFSKLKEDKENVDIKIKTFKKEVKDLSEIKAGYDIYLIKKSNLEDKNKDAEKIGEEIEKLKYDAGKLNSDIGKLRKDTEKLKDKESVYKKIKEELEDLNEKSKVLEIEKAGYDRELDRYGEELKRLNEEIERLLKIRQSIDYLNQLKFWLENSFINLMSIMEKKILLRVHYDFSSLFEKWFSMLVDSDTIKVRLDEEFTPLIEQNGHEIDYLYLSGGEKTAAALSYRLALNQVINKLMSAIKTKDILILDEPTDGFSEEQLDRLRLVLDDLEATQIILVSHENKIESFVDHVIRFNKEGHETRVMY